MQQKRRMSKNTAPRAVAARMSYIGMPSGMWTLFAGSFRRSLSTALGYKTKAAREITAKAAQDYGRIIARLPQFEQGDRFRMNIVSCAMFSAFLLNLPEKPTVEQAADYYREAMTTGALKRFCRRSAKKKFTDADVAAMEATAALRAADRNPYSWNMEFRPYPDGSGYEARFTHCGICTLMKELELSEYIPAMCRLDYTMSELGGAAEFVREHTLAEGGAYCDCGYKKKAAGAAR